MSKKGYVMSDSTGFENGAYAPLDNSIFDDGTTAKQLKELVNCLHNKISKLEADVKTLSNQNTVLKAAIELNNVNIELLKAEVL